MHINRARRLRQDRTYCEKAMWNLLRNRNLLGFKFRRQQPIGPFFVDFFCFEKNLVIELDGPHHELQLEYDQRRDIWLKKHGFTVLRYKNEDFLNGDFVLETIKKELQKKVSICPLTLPSPVGRGKIHRR